MFCCRGDSYRWASFLSPTYALFHMVSTLKGLVASPYEESLPTPLPTGTCTRQETPSFAWRTKT